jgi:hypothetical protein
MVFKMADKTVDSPCGKVSNTAQPAIGKMIDWKAYEKLLRKDSEDKK